MFQLKLCFSIFSMLMLIQTILSVPIDISNDLKDCQDSQACSMNIKKNLLQLLTLLTENKLNNGGNPSHLQPVASNQKYKQLLIKLLQLEIMITERESVMPEQSAGDNNTLLIKLLAEMCRYELEKVKQNINDSNSQLRQLLLQLLVQQQQQLNAAKSQGAEAAATNQKLIALLAKLLSRPENTVTVYHQNPSELPQHVLRPGNMVTIYKQNPCEQPQYVLSSEGMIMVYNQNPCQVPQQVVPPQPEGMVTIINQQPVVQPQPEDMVTIINQKPVVLPQPNVINIQPERPGKKPAGPNKKLVPVVVDLVKDELDLVEDKLGDVTSVLI